MVSHDAAEKGLYEFFAFTAPENGYPDRVEQCDMAEEILYALDDKEDLMVEARAGIGKTFGYLAPALLYQRYRGECIVIATSTIALQEQLAEDVATMSRMLSLHAEAVVIKGQTHYICPKRAQEYLVWHKDPIIEDEILNGACERKDLSKEITDEAWEHMCVNWSGKRCKWRCPYASTSGYAIL